MPPTSAPAGYFLALEGGEGAGKSTQAALLARWLRDRGHEVVVTREPGATAVGARVRALLLGLDPAVPVGEAVEPRTEALLYAADRAEHVARVVRPGLARGAIVVSDRYVDSSIAYQGHARGMDPDQVARLSDWATEGLLPDLTVLLDLPVGSGRTRLAARGGTDRLEQEADAFHERVRDGFRQLAAAAPERYAVIDAAGAADAVAALVQAAVAPAIPPPSSSGRDGRRPTGRIEG